jgi:catalase
MCLVLSIGKQCLSAVACGALQRLTEGRATDTRRNPLLLAVPAALLGAMFSCTVLADNLTRDNGAPVGDSQNSQTVFFSHVSEATNTLTHPHSDVGIPATSQMMDGNSVDAFKFVNAGDEITSVKFHWKTPNAGKQVTRCEWHSSLSPRTLVGFRFSLRVPTFISGTPSQALVASSGSNAQESSCSG